MSVSDVVWRVFRLGEMRCEIKQKPAHSWPVRQGGLSCSGLLSISECKGIYLADDRHCNLMRRFPLPADAMSHQRHRSIINAEALGGHGHVRGIMISES